MKTLHIAIVDKIATYQQRDGEIVCGNSDYVIEFAFDSEWDEHTDKVARFVIGNHYENVSFIGTTCPVPVITNTTSISVGVYAGNLCTTTPATIGCKKSILCATAAEGKSPILNGDSAYIRYSAYADGTDFTEEWHEDQNYIGIATGQTAPTTKEGYKWALFTQGTVDSELSLESENPAQNKVITQEFRAFNQGMGEFNERLSTLEKSGGGGEYEIPTFDLAALGLSTIIPNGQYVQLETDTTDIIAALEKGAVKFIVAFNMGANITVSLVLNPACVLANGQYSCTCMNEFNDAVLITTIDVGDGLIAAKCTPMDNIIGAYINVALGGDY
jgi:hypothetical protein